MIPHADYEGQDHRNDIALMKLSRKVDFDEDHIQHICLGSEEFYQETIFDHLHHYAGWVAGWGSLREGGGSTAILQVGVFSCVIEVMVGKGWLGVAEWCII